LTDSRIYKKSKSNFAVPKGFLRNRPAGGYNSPMTIARSIWRKGVATLVAAVAFVSLHEVTILDSQRGLGQGAAVFASTGLPAPGARLDVTATAYCKGATTASGVAAQHGVAAADPRVLPVGSVVQVDTGDNRYSGIYTIMDTGPAIQGPQLDVYLWNCNEALQFGRRLIQLMVLRLGWNPRATTPGFMDRLFRHPDTHAARTTVAGLNAND
jgi:3D (Asp-Asp-Asp) domain-containing protein